MLERLPVFGAELRRSRLAAGLTLAQFSAVVHYSKGQISKVETGHKRATPEFARLCDAALDAGGRLIALVPPGHRRADGPASPSRRGVMAAGAASVLAVTSGTRGHGSDVSARSDGIAAQDVAAGAASLPDATYALLDHYRQLGQVAPPSALLPGLVAQTRSVADLASGARARAGRALFRSAARFAEFTGWMAQEAGDEAAALHWTGHAVDLAAAGGDDDLAAYALVRRALITYYRSAAGDTIALAQGARHGKLPARIRGLAAQRVAQGHALAGDHTACMRDLDIARALLTADAAEPGARPLGTSHLTDPVSMITGWCLVDLGRPREAARTLDRELALVPDSALRTHARYGTRRALAHALAGDIDQACAYTDALLLAVGAVASATVALDLKRLTRVLARHHRSPAYRALAPQLAALPTAERC